MTRFAAARRFLLWVHLGVGLAAGLYATLLGATGSLLVFRAEIEEWERPQIRNPVSPNLGIRPQEILATARAAYPGWRPLSITMPTADRRSMIYLLRGREARQVYFDSLSGREIGSFDPKSGWSGWLAALHTNLLLGRTGSRLNGYGACALLVLCFTGIILWLPSAGKGWWQQAKNRLRIDRQVPPRRLFWQLHHAVGVGSLLFIALLSVTGTYFVWSSAYVRFVGSNFGRTTEPTVPTHAVDSALLPMEVLIERATKAMPGLPVHRIQVVDGAGQPVRVTLLNGSPQEFHLVSTVFLDPVTGTVLKTNALAARPWGDMILSWFSALHFGVFGGWPIRLLWALMGMSLPVLAISGAGMWWYRVLRPIVSRQSKPEVEAAVGASV